jgi:hypothetical protein
MDLPLTANRQRNCGSVINQSHEVAIVDNRVQLTVAGDATIKLFGGVSAIHARETSSPENLRVGVARVPNTGSAIERP